MFDLQKALKELRGQKGFQMTYENWSVTNGTSISHSSLANSHMSFGNCLWLFPIFRIFKPEHLFRSGLMVSVPLRFERHIIDFINPEQRERSANRMRWTGFADPQYGQGRLSSEFANELKFWIGEGCHQC